MPRVTRTVGDRGEHEPGAQCLGGMVHRFRIANRFPVGKNYICPQAR